MATTNDEDERLRAVALRNAQSILLARRRSEEDLRRQSEWLRVTLASIGDAVISTDADGRVTFMNGVAEALTGWPAAEALGRPLQDVFHIINEHTREPADNPALRALREGAIVALANHTVLISRDGSERPIDDSAAPILDAESNERLVTEDLDDVLTRLEPIAKSLHCADELAAVSDICQGGASYQRQRRVAEEHDGDLRAVVDALVAELDI